MTSELQRFNPLASQSATGVCQAPLIIHDKAYFHFDQQIGLLLFPPKLQLFYLLRGVVQNAWICSYRMPRPGLNSIWAFVLAAMVLLSSALPAQALPGWVSRNDSRRRATHPRVRRQAADCKKWLRLGACSNSVWPCNAINLS